jgi:transposase-like protein
MTEEKKKLYSYTLEFKLDVLKDVDNGEMSMRQYARKHGISPSCIRDWKIARPKYEEKKKDHSISIEKIRKLSHGGPQPNEQLETELLEWFLDRQEKHLRIKDKFIRAKARALASTIPGLSTFSASNGFIENFKNRNDIGSRAASNMKPLPPNAPELVTEFFSTVDSISNKYKVVANDLNDLCLES